MTPRATAGPPPTTAREAVEAALEAISQGVTLTGNVRPRLAMAIEALVPLAEHWLAQRTADENEVFSAFDEHHGARVWNDWRDGWAACERHHGITDRDPDAAPARPR